MNEALLGVVVGGFIAAGFTWLLDYFKEKREQERLLQNERKKVYQDFILLIEQLKNKEKLDTSFLKGLSVLMKMYSSKKIWNEWARICNELETDGKTNVDGVINKIRAEIGIKENLPD